MKLNKLNKIGLMLWIIVFSYMSLSFYFLKDLSKLGHSPLAYFLFFLPFLLVMLGGFLFNVKDKNINS